MNKISFKIETPSYNALSTVQKTVRSSELNNTPPIWGLTQIRDVVVTEDKYNIFTEKQKKMLNY